MPGLFITATGTDIGKTFVMVGLIRAFRARGLTVSALKPIISGFDDADPSGSDSALLLTALDKPVNQAELDIISPWRFKAPLSPDMAARKENRSIDFEAVVTYCQSRIAITDGPIFIEGVGGIMVPLNEHFTVLDLMMRLALSVVLVSGTYLGAISHLLSAIDVLKRHGVSPTAVVICESETSSVTMPDMLVTLKYFCANVPLIQIARQSSPRSSDTAFSELVDMLQLL
jgi:dethiobiotin synthetase